MLTLRAAQRICAQEGFDEALDTTRDRIDQIEGMCPLASSLYIPLQKLGGTTGRGVP